MAFNGYLYLLYLGVLTVIISSSVLIMAAAVTNPTTLVDRTSLNRSSFPKGFIFGTASSSYQIPNHFKIDFVLEDIMYIAGLAIDGKQDLNECDDPVGIIANHFGRTRYEAIDSR
ncbi:hypothetical protein TSUD_88580 [Trifolium subterraneum]|uniref:Beta-glucosidase n=1 Tax=Trifolium subterraneum TaxID=3900 RepID=A0A2Z6NZ67_TRISU|nr:hypothetical protein TSUD_88580 [Trifolium subterraneum]